MREGGAKNRRTKLLTAERREDLLSKLVGPEAHSEHGYNMEGRPVYSPVIHELEIS